MTISAKVVADSVSPKGKRVTTIEIECPRLILAEINTHKMISKNYSSTRAIPILSQLEMIGNNPALPVFYGRNQSGMVAQEGLSGAEQEECEKTILNMLDFVMDGVKHLHKVGLHKQSACRYLEPWMHVKGVLTSTEWANFFWLRNHPDAQPEFQVLAKAIEDAMIDSIPSELNFGDWHTPYYGDGYWTDSYSDDTLEDALRISASCTAQVSYRKTDDSLEKADKVFGMLNIGSEDKPQHVSPTEHQCTPIRVDYDDGCSINLQDDAGTWEDGVTAYHKELGFMSGNLAGWIQYRQTIKGHTKW